MGRIGRSEVALHAGDSRDWWHRGFLFHWLLIFSLLGKHL